MKQVLSGTAAGLLLLVLTTVASAQHYNGNRYSGGNYGQPYGQPQYSQYGYAPNNCNPYANSGGYYNYSTPSYGFGAYSNPSYGSGFNIYSGSNFGQSYYQTPYSGGYGRNQSHHHHHHR